MEDAKEQAKTSLSKFSHALDQVEQTLRPVLKSLDELRASGNEEDLDAMSRARMHISLAYSVNTLFCMYLRTQGVDPATHPVSEEIGRVQEAFMRMRKVEAGLSVDHQRAPDRDRRRHYENMRKSSQKLAGLVFPEEVDLLNALRGNKRKRETEQGGKQKKVRKEKESEQQSEDESDSSDDGGNINHKEGPQRSGNSIEQLETAKREHATISSEEESEGEKMNELEKRNANEAKVTKKTRKPKKNIGAEINSDTNKTKEKSEKKSEKKSKKEKKNKKSKEQEDIGDQQMKSSARSEQKRKRKKKSK